jgi:hypothetical protein
LTHPEEGAAFAKMNLPQKQFWFFASIRRFGGSSSLVVLIAATVLGTGCVTSGRRVLLKEYGPSIPVLDHGTLKDSIICLRGFDCASNLVSLELTTKPEEPEPFKYLDLTREQDKLWDREMNDLRKQTTQANWREIGNMRNGFGMVMSHVYALNDPAAWLTESLKFDLEAQGAKVVDPSQAANADVSISGTIQLCRTDMYMVVNASLVVDIAVQPKQGEVRHKRIHTRGATAAMLASEGEYFHALRDARQKFSILATREISQAMKPNP